MKVTSNGRSTYDELRTAYDKVYVRHQKNEDGTVKTVCVLVEGNNLHVGVSKFSNRTYSYNKKKGRLIAQGRAELAAAVSAGTETSRTTPRRETLSFTVTCEGTENLETAIGSFIS